MCGIAGTTDSTGIETTKIIKALKHRGPDQDGIYEDDQLTLIQTRLAIQDIKEGKQPFEFSHYVIIFNGEIYNHQDLRKELNEFTFKTNSDTETLLYLFIKFNVNMFSMLDGMFAFCIYDKAERKIILARDRAGKKPLYYHQVHNYFYFASELNTLKIMAHLQINTEAINSYLRSGFIWGNRTAYQDVHEVEAGCYLQVDLCTLTYQALPYVNLLQQFYNLSSSPLNLNETILLLDQKLKKSIHDRINASDVEVGVFLSGGIDSNLIAAMAASFKPKIKTFTVTFRGQYDESNLAALTAKKYGTEHHALSISSHLDQDIEKILCAYGEPFMDSSAIPSYYVSREAAKFVKVILSGDGADELFAGYRRYVPIRYKLYRIVKLFASFRRFLPQAHQKKSLYNYIYRLLTISHKKSLDFYLSATTDIFEEVKSFPVNTIDQKLIEFLDAVFANKNLSDINQFLYADFSIILFSDLLVKMDIASMAHSLEVRSPFLSKYLLEFAPTLPDDYKIKRFKTKYILRKLAENYLPKALIHQPKRGFEVPLKNWVDTELKAPIHDLLQPGCYAENFVGKDLMTQLLQNKLYVSKEKRAKMLWSLYCLQVWHHHETKINYHR